MIQDIGYITYIKKSREKSLLIKVLSKNNGVVYGFINNGLNKYKYYKNQIGNFVQFTSTASNDNFNIIETELIKSNLEAYFYRKSNLIVFNSAVALINSFVKENEEIDNIYNIFNNLICNMIKHNDIWLYYIDFLLSILDHIGININVNKCYLTGKNDTYYISPKTGNCVIKELGEKYKNNLFVIPRCLKSFDYSMEDILNTLKICFYFINKFIKENNLFYMTNELNFITSELYKEFTNCCH